MGMEIDIFQKKQDNTFIILFFLFLEIKNDRLINQLKTGVGNQCFWNSDTFRCLIILK